MLPSPDGSLVASMNPGASRITLYNPTGHAQATYSGIADAAWLSDSSGLFLWQQDPSTPASGPLSIMDRQGAVHATGVNAGDPMLSPDGTWIVATDYGDTIQHNQVVAFPRAGGQAHVLAQGADALGWQTGNVIYWSSGGVYSVAPTGGSARLLAQVPNGEYLRPLLYLSEVLEEANSPDDQALVAVGHRGELWVIGGTQLRQPPSDASQTPGLMWTGSHDVLGVQSQGDLTILDVLTGAVVRDTGISAPSSVEAVVGSWVVGASGTTSADFSAVNLATKQQVDLGIFPAQMRVLPLGQGGFLLHDSPGSGATYLVDLNH